MNEGSVHHSPLVNGGTQVIVLMAWPATHVRTPSFFNTLCAARGINAIMIPWAVRPEHLVTAWEGVRRVENLAGVVLTIPHKQTSAPLCDELEGDAKLLDVVNAVRHNADGTFTGRMFDGVGFVEGMLREGIALQGKRVLMIGAGGAATAIALSLARQQVTTLAVANRSVEKSQQLVELLSRVVPGVKAQVDRADPRGYDVVINATSLGLKPDDALPCDVALIEPGTVVGEVVMQPAITKFLEAASQRGARIHKGEAMVLPQLDLFVDFLLGGRV